MDRGYALVEQLDLAAEQLAVGSPVAARFGLILCDNVVELVLHQVCTQEVLWDRHLSRSLPPKYDENTRRAATGKHFDSKARFCAKLGVLTQEDLESVLAIHAYRNELYHVGIRHDAIILPLAWLYFEIACGLLPKQRVGMWRIVDPSSPRVVRHVGELDILGTGVWERGATSLMQARPSLPSPFAELLADFACEEMDDCRVALEFLVEDNPSGKGQAEILDYIQFRFYCFEDGDPPRIEPANVKSVRELDSKMEGLRIGWRPKYRESPLARWRRSAEGLKQEADPHRALKRFETLQTESQWFRSLVHDAAAELEVYIQNEMDLMRGR